METIQTAAGELQYTLTRKKIKNLNLRIQEGGSLVVSAPLRMPKDQIEGFIRQKAAWIVKTRQKVLARGPQRPCLYTKEECLALFGPIADSFFPLFSDLLGGRHPQLKVREMKTRWGVCNIPKRTITLNTRLAEKPLAAVEYVILHEFVHFLHPNHQAGFHAEMARLMPDYLQRRKLLKQ